MSKKKIYGLYDVCLCNHEFLQHDKICSARIPVGFRGYRGYISQDVLAQSCGCKKFLFNKENTANPKPTEDSDE